MLQLDEVDRRIIASLAADARASYADIGTVVSLSAPAVKRRVDRLRSAGVIKGYTVVLDPSAASPVIEAFVELFCTGRTSPTQLAAIAGRQSEVIAAYSVAGAADALLHLRAADIASLERAIERLRDEPYVTSTRSMIVLAPLLDPGSRLPTLR